MLLPNYFFTPTEKQQLPEPYDSGSCLYMSDICYSVGISLFTFFEPIRA